MKIRLDKSIGVVTELAGDEILIDGVDGKQYPFKDLYDDLLGSVGDGNLAKGTSALTLEGYRDSDFPIYFMRHDQDDTLTIIYQMPHMWDYTTAVWPHIHYIPMAAASGNVYFSFSYVWAPRGEVVPALSSWVSGNKTISITAGDQFKHLAAGFATINPPAAAGASTMLLMKITRLGDDVLDTYNTNKTGGTAAANFGVLYLDLHYQKIRAGTTSQFY